MVAIVTVPVNGSGSTTQSIGELPSQDLLLAARAQ